MFVRCLLEVLTKEYQRTPSLVRVAPFVARSTVALERWNRDRVCGTFLTTNEARGQEYLLS
jgi:hypothetical protein